MSSGNFMIQEHKNNLDQWEETLYQQGFRNTEAQETLISVLSAVKSPMSAEEIREAVQHIRPKTGRATVYRFIDKLMDLGLLRRVHGYRDCNTYIPSLNAHQVLLICTQCEEVSYLSPTSFVRMMKSLLSSVNEIEEHQITTYHLQLFGTCTTCKTDQS